METITITFGDVAENHVGMQKVGNISNSGFRNDELKKIEDFFIGRYEIKCDTIYLNDYLPEDVNKESIDDARVLIIRNGVDSILSQLGDDVNKDSLFTELTSFEWDKKFKNYGKVMNKLARHNVCFGDNAQEPDYEKGKGRIIKWSDVPLLSMIKNDLEDILRNDGENEKEVLQGEGNRYYDITKCGIGYHGDSERRKVFALRVGASMKICFQWYVAGKPVGSKFETMINGGDMYVMNWKASGFDWKKKKIYTLRHAAGCDKFTKLKDVKKKIVIEDDSDDE